MSKQILKEVEEIIENNNLIVKDSLFNQSECRMTSNKSAIKKLFIYCITSLMAVLSFVLFAGCGGTSPVGVWTLDRVVVDNKTINSADEDKGDYASDFNNSITLKEDGTGTAKIKSDTSSALTWTQSEKSITITMEENNTIFTLVGTELIYQKDNVKYFYKKNT